MNDMRMVIVPKSDQLNSDDLIGGPISVTITKIEIRPGTEQPVSIGFAGDNGKPYKPCKSMCRVLVSMWGPDAKAYIGRSMTLYRDPTVKWGGMDVGGIRISHLSDIPEAHTMALTATKGSRKPFTVKPMARAAADPLVDLRATAEAEAAKGVAAYQAFWTSISAAQRKSLAAHHEALKAAAAAADADTPHDPVTGEIADPHAAAPAGSEPAGTHPATVAETERQQPDRDLLDQPRTRTAADEAFFATDDYEIPVPGAAANRPDWKAWGEALIDKTSVATAGELGVLRSHNANPRARCLGAAGVSPTIVSDIDRAYTAAEKRAGG